MLEGAYETFIRPDTPSPEIDLIVDGGSESRAEVDDFISQHDVAIRKMVAGKQISFSNKGEAEPPGFEAQSVTALPFENSYTPI